MPKSKIKIDEKSLCKKYRTNVVKLISAWKRGLTDMEIARSTGIDLATLNQIKSDIELAHRRVRLSRKKEALAAQTSIQHQIFFKPLI